MKLILLLAVVLSLAVSGRARHIQSNDLSSLQDTDLNIEIPEDPAAVEIIEKTADEIRNVIPTRFVPINDAMFFKSYPPCEEGFERDLHGVCREVWD